MMITSMIMVTLSLIRGFRRHP